MGRFGLGLGAAVVALALSAGTADAVPITGAISLSDGGVTVPPVPSTSIVSQLNTVTQGPPAANTCSGAFTTAALACNLAPPPALTASTINLLAPAGTIYTYGPFTFTLSSVSNIVRTPLAVSGTGLGNDALQFDMAGIVDDGPGGLDPTTWAGVWTGNGACIGNAGPPATCTENVTASYSSSIVATGIPIVVPEPMSLALLSSALIGIALVRRRRNRAA